MFQAERCATCKFIKPRRPRSQRAQPQVLSRPLFGVNFHIFLSCQAEQNPHPVSSAERRLLSCGGAGGVEVMSSLPLGGISLIKIKQYSPEWQSNGGGKRQGAEESEGLAPKDLKRRSSVFSFPPFFTFTSLSLHIFSTITSGSLFHHYCSPEQADLSAVRQEICPEALRWAAKYRGWIVTGTKDPPKKHDKRPGPLTTLRVLHVRNVYLGSAITEAQLTFVYEK